MKTQIKMCMAAAMLLTMSLGASGQFRGTFIVDQSFDISGVALGLRQNGDVVVGGVLTTPPTDGRDLAGYYIEDANPNYSLQLCDFNGNPNGIITSVADAVGTGFNAAVGFTHILGRPDEEGFFLDIQDGLVKSHTAVFFSGPGNDRPRRVLELPDHSFVIVGSMTESLAQFSTVTRLQPRPDYSHIFTRRIGNRFLTNTNVDEAVDVAQMADGNLLVVGNTLHYSNSGEGSIYLMKMGLDGLLHQFRTLTIGNGVLEPRATDMAILNNGTIIVIGHTRIPNSTEHRGFIMTLPPDFTSATFLELSLNPQLYLGMELTGLCPVPGTNAYYCSGKLFHTGQFNNRESSSLVLRANSSTGIESIRRINNLAAFHEEYEDILIRDNGLTLETVGITEERPAGITSSAGGSNIVTDRMQLSMFACNSTGFLVTQLFKAATPQLVLPASVSVNNVVLGTMSFQSGSSLQGPLCAGAKRDDAPVAPEAIATAPRLYPNPARDHATLEFPPSEGFTTVEISDAMGKVLFRTETSDSKLDLDLSRLSKGLILIRTQQNGKEFIQKLIHQ